MAIQTFTWIPNHEYKEEIDYDVDQTQYISGAQQRYLNNPDPIGHKFHLNFVNRATSEITDIVNFLKARKGPWEAFYYVSLLDGATYTVHFIGPIPPATQTNTRRKISLVFEITN